MSDVGHPHVTPRRSAAATNPTTVKLGKGRFTTSPSILRTHDIRHLAAVKQLACVFLVIDSESSIERESFTVRSHCLVLCFLKIMYHKFVQSFISVIYKLTAIQLHY